MIYFLWYTLPLTWYLCAPTPLSSRHAGRRWACVPPWSDYEFISSMKYIARLHAHACTHRRRHEKQRILFQCFGQCCSLPAMRWDGLDRYYFDDAVARFPCCRAVISFDDFTESASSKWFRRLLRWGVLPEYILNYTAIHTGPLPISLYHKCDVPELVERPRSKWHDEEIIC